MSSSVKKADHRDAHADLNVGYWTCISDRCTKWDQWLKFIVALTASGTVAAWGIWAQYPTIWKALSATACIAAVGHPIFFPSERLKRISGLVARWKEIFITYELLWEQDSELSQSDSWKRFQAAKVRESSLDETTLPKSNKLIEKTFDQVCRKRGIHGQQRISETAGAETNTRT
jgi:hypothetical protein